MPVPVADRLTLEDIRHLPTITPKQLCAVFDLNMNSVIKALHNGDLPGFKVGSLWRVPTAKLLAMLESETARAA